MNKVSIRLLAALGVVAALTACDNQGFGAKSSAIAQAGSLGAAIDPINGNISTYNYWKANGQINWDVYGAKTHNVSIWFNKSTGKFDVVGVDVDSSNTVEQVRRATASLCRVPVSQVPVNQNDRTINGTVVNPDVQGRSLECTYMKRFSDGVGSIMFEVK